MKRQRGFGWMEAVICIIALAALFFAVKAVISEVAARDERIRSTAYAAGRAQALKEVSDRDNKELVDAQAEIAGLILERDTAAALHAEAQARLKSNHAKEIRNAKTETDRLLADVRTGSLVLRDPGRAEARACGAVEGDAGSGGSGGAGASAAAAPPGSGQAVGQGLSKQASEFLLTESARADEVATDLELCWGIARDDRTKLLAAPPL